MRYENKTIMVQSMAGAGNSTIVDLRNVINLSLQFLTTSASSPTGSLAVLFANDCTVGPTGIISGGTFGVDAAVTPPSVNVNGCKMLNMLELGHLFCMVQYVFSTGSGTLTVITGTKGA